MNEVQFKRLLLYIDAAIEEKIDPRSSSDEGLLSSIAKTKAESALREVLVNETDPTAASVG